MVLKWIRVHSLLTPDVDSLYKLINSKANMIRIDSSDDCINFDESVVHLLFYVNR